MAPDLRPEDRLALYQVAVEESRFNVLLGWDRAKHFLVFNGVLLGAAPGLLKLSDTLEGEALVAALLVLGAFHSYGGAHVVRMGHSYYRQARDKVVIHEEQLGLFRDPETAKLAIATTPGKAEAIAKKTGGPVVGLPRWKWGNITDQIRMLLTIVAILDAVGALILVFRIARRIW